MALVLFVGTETLMSRNPGYGSTVSAQIRPSREVDDRKVDSKDSSPTADSLTRLLEIQSQITHLVPILSPAVVAVEGGSGVIVNETGYILTASHVTKRAGRKVVVRLADGRSATAITLGTNANTDSGALKILDKGPWPFIPLTDPPIVSQGDWCMAVGYPFSFARGKPASLRIGRILSVTEKRYVTDCPIMGGDSGGPLFNLKGELIGISSRVKTDISHNIHVPIKNYQDQWNDLSASKDTPLETLWINQSYLGILPERDLNRVRIKHVYRNSPAAAAGLLKNDVIVSFGGKEINKFADVTDVLSDHQPGNIVSARLNRSGKQFSVAIRLGKPTKSKPKKK